MRIHERERETEKPTCYMLTYRITKRIQIVGVLSAMGG